MAKPRVFVSSTFYDLRQVRSELDHFIREMGYEAVLNERGDIPYDHRRSLEDSCYDEISKVDILVSIVGGRYGTQSARDSKSISQQEVKTALQLRKPVTIFVDRSVQSEYHTYARNKASAEVLARMCWHHVDNVRVFEFLDELSTLPLNNATFPFDLAADITSTLKLQWAGLFQAALQREREDAQRDILVTLESSLRTAGELASLLKEKADKMASPDLVERILLTNHPAFLALRRVMKTEYPTPFYDITELAARYKAWGFELLAADTEEEVLVFERKLRSGEYLWYAASKKLFDSAGKLAIPAAEFRDDMISPFQHMPF